MSVESSAVCQSVDFFGSADNYAPMSTLPSGGKVITCVDPRVIIGLPYPRSFVTAQTAGGLTGEGMDGSLYLGAELGAAVGIEQGVKAMRSWNPDDEAYAHLRCKNNVAALAILEEMADPTASTWATMSRWAHTLNHPHERGDRVRTQRAAGNLVKLLRGKTLEYLAEAPDSCYAVHDVAGDNESRVYVDGLVSGVGLRRDNRPTSSEGERVQGYHDTVADSVWRAHEVKQLDRSGRRLLGYIRLARSAATRELLTRDHAREMHGFAVLPGRGDRVRVEPVDF